MLSPLKGKLDKIVLLACLAAHVASENSRGGDGDGELLCKRLAKLTGAWVKASTFRQKYDLECGKGTGRRLRRFRRRSLVVLA